MKLILFTFLTIINFKSFAQLTFTEYPCNTTGSSFPWALKVFKNTLYFSAMGNTWDKELWSFDGTSTKLFKDINATSPSASSQPNSFFEANDQLFFTADNGIIGREFWTTNGSSFGTKIMKDIVPGALGANPQPLIEFNKKLYFFIDDHSIVGNKLWFSDGTALGTDSLKGVHFQTNGVAVFNNRLYFGGSESPYTYQTEIWSTDGTSAGTYKVKDIFPGDSGSIANSFFVFKDKLFFGANDGVNGYELWVSDGTRRGTKLFKDINIGKGNSSPMRFIEMDGKMYFVADDGIHGQELWVSDGTSIGTSLIKDINTYTGTYNSSTPGGMTIYQGKLYFQAFEYTTGHEFWCTDGTEIGTKLVKDINTSSSYSSYPNWFTVYGNKMYFSAVQDTLGEQLFETDGTDSGTIMISPSYLPLVKNALEAYPHFTKYNNSLFFKAKYRNNESQLWSITDKALNIEELDLSSKIKIFPNPSKGLYTIEGLHAGSDIEIYSIGGQIVLKEKCRSNQFEFNLNNVSSGIYMVCIKNKNGQISNIKILKD